MLEFVSSPPSLRSVIAEALSLSEAAVTPSLSYQSIEAWDSLGHVGLMVALEKAYGHRIDEDAILELTNVAAIESWVRGGRQAKLCKPSLVDGERTVYRGLQGVYFDHSAITMIDGNAGDLLHRGYAIADLAANVSYEAVSFLLMFGHLPSAAEEKAFEQRLCALRGISEDAMSLLRHLTQASPTIALRTVVSAFPSPQATSRQAVIDTGISLIAQVPTIIAAHHAFRCGREPIAPHPSLGHAANFLYMLTGSIPCLEDARLLDGDFVAHADHGANASTFAARVVTGTQADVVSAVTAAMAAFAGPLHGGALEKAMQMLREIKHVDAAAVYVQKRLANRLPVYGFGHRVYKTQDPRSFYLRAIAQRLSEKYKNNRWLDILEAVAKEMTDYAAHGVNINVDFYACVAYTLLEIPDSLMVPTFMACRTAGWVAQALEQYDNNILIRPRLNYTGEPERAVPRPHYKDAS